MKPLTFNLFNTYSILALMTTFSIAFLPDELSIILSITLLSLGLQFIASKIIDFFASNYTEHSLKKSDSNSQIPMNADYFMTIENQVRNPHYKAPSVIPAEENHL